MADFKAEVFQNEFLAEGATDVHAVVSVTCTNAGTAGQSGSGEAAEIIIVDTSGSMDMPSSKIVAARRAAKVALGEIVDGTWFAVISGHSVAQMVYPSHPGMAKMTDVTRREATHMIDALRAGGATAIGAWISAATELFSQVQTAQRHAILLTDGHIEGEPASALPQALAVAQGQFQCDCRGIGSDWVVDELRTIADALLGTVDIIAKPDDLEADFEAMMRTSMSRGVADARLRVWAPQGSEVLFVRQVAPTVEDLTAKAVQVTPLVREFPTGAWSDESRDYHVAVRVPVAPLGNERLAARVEVVINDEVVAKSLVKATWSADANLTTRIDPAVAHYTGQAQLADAIQKGLAAKAAGDDRTATVLLGEAAKIAHESGNEDTTRLLSKVVDVVDAEAGTVRLKSNIERTDEMALDTQHQDHEDSSRAVTTYTCPNGHQSADPEWCDTCGAPIGGSPEAAPAPVERAAAPASPSPSSPSPSSPSPSSPTSGSMIDCPNCGLSNDSGNLFCEQCGYDFTTGQAPPKPATIEAPAEPLSTPDSSVKWVVVVEVDPVWYGLKGSLADQPCPPSSSSTVALTQHTALIGRSSQSRDIHPEVALEGDTGVSRRHAQLVRDGDGLSVIDLSSTNGTYLVPAGTDPAADTEAVEAGVPTPLNDGDRIYVGAWSRLTVRLG